MILLINVSTYLGFKLVFICINLTQAKPERWIPVIIQSMSSDICHGIQWARASPYTSSKSRCLLIKTYKVSEIYISFCTLTKEIIILYKNLTFLLVKLRNWSIPWPIHGSIVTVFLRQSVVEPVIPK